MTQMILGSLGGGRDGTWERIAPVVHWKGGPGTSKFKRGKERSARVTLISQLKTKATHRGRCNSVKKTQRKGVPCRYLNNHMKGTSNPIEAQRNQKAGPSSSGISGRNWGF